MTNSPNSHTRRRIAGFAALAAGCILALVLVLKFSAPDSPNTGNSPAPVAPEVATTQAAAGSIPKGLYFVAGPPDGPDIARQTTQRVAGDRSQTLPPLPVYTLMAADGTGVAHDASQFMYFVVSGGHTVASAMVNMDPATGRARRGRVTEGGTNMSAEELDRLANLERVRAGSYEARLLSIRTVAGNTFPVIWLKADSGTQDDLYYPYRNYYDSGVQPETFYRLEDLLGLLAPP